MPLAGSGSDRAMIKKWVQKNAGCAEGSALVSSTYFVLFRKKNMQQYRTSAFGPSKTRRNIDILFANMLKHVVKLTLVLQICQNMSLNLHYFCKYVKTRR